MALAAIVFLATGGTATAASNEAQPAATEKVQVSEQGAIPATRHFPLASEVSSVLSSDDPESLRIELIFCLLLMLVVSVGALVGVCCADCRPWTQGRLSTDKERPPLPTA